MTNQYQVAGQLQATATPTQVFDEIADLYRTARAELEQAKAKFDAAEQRMLAARDAAVKHIHSVLPTSAKELANLHARNEALQQMQGSLHQQTLQNFNQGGQQ